MIWVVSRVYARAIWAWLFASAAFITFVLVFASVATPLGSCRTASCGGGSQALGLLTQGNEYLRDTLIGLPAVVGIFVVVPLIVSDLERKTHRLLWTLGVTPVRWLVTEYGAALFFSLLLGGAVALSTEPFRHTLSAKNGGMWPAFEIYPPVLEAYVAFAVSAGALMATVTGQRVAAIAGAAITWIGLRLVTSIVRPYLISPEVRVGLQANAAQGDWSLGVTYVDNAGHIVSEGQADAVLRSFGPTQDPYTLLGQHGIHVAELYQPASRFWLIQGIETVLFVAAGLVCLACCIWWVNRRLARA
jgi:hypothetical protein